MIVSLDCMVPPRGAAVADAADRRLCVRPSLGTEADAACRRRLRFLQVAGRKLGGVARGDGWWKRYSDAQLDQLISEGARRLARSCRRRGALPACAGFGPGSRREAVADNRRERLRLQSSTRAIISACPCGTGSRRSGMPASASTSISICGARTVRLCAARRRTRMLRVTTPRKRVSYSTTGIASAYADLTALYAQRESSGERARHPHQDP